MPQEGAHSPISVSVSVLTQLVRYLGHLQIDIAPLFCAAGVDPGILDRPDERMPIEAYIAVEEEAARVSADPCFGLHMGEFHEPGHWSILGYMMMNCRTLGEAFGKSGKYYGIIGNLLSMTPHLGFRKVKFVLTTPKHAPVLSRHCFESVLSSSASMMRHLSGRSIEPLEVGFSYPAPASPSEYLRVFRCPVLFSQKQTYILMNTSVASIPILAPNQALLEHFERFAREILADIESVDETSRIVVRHILERLDDLSLSVGSVARTMSMSARTLQSRLKAEGTAFARLLEETKERIAKKHLRENMTVEEITCLLGFSESSAFRKAFKRWTGMTPKEYRDGAR
jgi:AraC-like DNA-binding protein